MLRFCHDTKIKVVPRGAGTSLCGGALPLEDAIVLGISRMSKVLAIDVQLRGPRRGRRLGCRPLKLSKLNDLGVETSS